MKFRKPPIVVIALLINLIISFSLVVAQDFNKPKYAPEYVPPIATGNAHAIVGANGADLSGTWTIQLDGEIKSDEQTDDWYNAKGFANKIDLPGALQNAGYGSDVSVNTEWMGVSGLNLWFTNKYEKYRQEGNIKVPFFLQPEKRFIGDAYYQKTIEIGDDAPKDKDLILTLERTHWETTVWLDGNLIGSNNALGVPHVYNLGKNLIKGNHILLIKVNNTQVLPVGSRAHSISDETQGAWNGIIGKLTLDWRNQVYIQNVKVFTDYKTKSAKVKVFVNNATPSLAKSSIVVHGKAQNVKFDAGINIIETDIQFSSEAELWSEFHPVLHEVRVELNSKEGKDSKNIKVGIRNLETQGTKFLVNGKEVFMRGTLDCCIFPKTGFPPMDKESWLAHLGKMKASGINHVRFHSWCPPKAAFEAGDELGMYLMPEIHIWGNPSDQKFGTWVTDEGKRIIDEYGNHPSFAFFTHGNEPWRGEANSTFLAELTKEMKSYDSRMLHTASANTIQSEYDEFICTTQPRGTIGWKGKGYHPEFSNPFIQHEPGQWCAYPNFDEMVKYTGPLKPKNFEIFLEQAEENGVLPQWNDFLNASGKLQMLCYKEDCEAALASEGVSGTQLLSIQDFSGQGTSLVGYLDAFLDEKGYFTKEQFFKFWNWSVPLARMSSYIYKNSDTLYAPVIYAYFGEEELTNQALNWTIVDEQGKLALSGSFTDVELKSGRNKVGNIQVSLKNLAVPAHYTLTLSLEGTEISNSWEFLVCEDDPSIDMGTAVVHHDINENLEKDLNEGKSVLFMPHNYSLAHPKMSFQPVYWNKFLFAHKKDRVTLGLLVKDKHPAFNNFPVKNHTTWGGENILDNSYGLAMENLPKGGMIVQPIDDWNRNRYLGYIFEYKVGNGKLLVCMPDLLEMQKTDQAAKQLLSSILTYLNSNNFAPTARVELNTLSEALKYSSNKSTMLSLGADVIATSHKWKNSHGYAIDGDDATKWIGALKNPSYITIDLKKSTPLQGILLSNTNTKGLKVYMGDDPDNLHLVKLKDKDFNNKKSLILKEENMNTTQEIGFSEQTSGRYLRIEISSVYGKTIEFGEIDVIFTIM